MVIFGVVVAAIFASWSAIMHGAASGNRAAATAQRSRVALRKLEEALGATRSYVADVQYYTFNADNGSEPYLSFVSKAVAYVSSQWPVAWLRRSTSDVCGGAGAGLLEAVGIAPESGADGYGGGGAELSGGAGE